MPASKIEDHTIETCDVKLPRFRREIDALAAEDRNKRSTVKKQSRIINGADIEPFSWPWLVRLNFLTQIQFNNIEGASKAGFQKDAIRLSGTLVKFLKTHNDFGYISLSIGRVRWSYVAEIVRFLQNFNNVRVSF